MTLFIEMRAGLRRIYWSFTNILVRLDRRWLVKISVYRTDRGSTFARLARSERAKRIPSAGMARQK